MRLFRAAVTGMLLTPGFATAQSDPFSLEAEASLHATIAALSDEIDKIERKLAVIAATKLAALHAIGADNPSLEIYHLVLNTLPELPELADLGDEVDTPDELLDFLGPISDDLRSADSYLLRQRGSFHEQLAELYDDRVEAMIARQ